MPESRSPKGENPQQAQLSEVFICTKCDFLNIWAQHSPGFVFFNDPPAERFCSSSWLAGHLFPPILQFGKSGNKGISGLREIFTRLGESTGLTAPDAWFVIAVDFFLRSTSTPMCQERRWRDQPSPGHVFLIRGSQPARNPACCCMRLHWFPGAVTWSLPYSRQL